MIELFSTFSTSQIIIIVVMIALAVKELLSLLDFFTKRTSEFFNKEQKKKDEKQEILDEIEKLNEAILRNEAEIQNTMQQLIEIREKSADLFAQQQEALDMLIKSDIDDIKSYIVKQYNTFMQQEWIDPFSMDAIEKRFEHYQHEGGNSYVENLVEKLRQLPNHPNH